MTGFGSSCGACKFLRRRCGEDCVFAPHFCYDEASSTFAAVHKVFGASNVSKLLSNLPEQNRGEAALTISYEALARMDDPIYGCVAHIFALQQQIVSLQEEIETLEIQMASQALSDNNLISNSLQFATKIDNGALEFLSHQNEMFTHMRACQPRYENQIISQNRDVLSNHGILLSEMNFFPPSQVYGLDEQISLDHLSLNHSERLLVAVEEETYIHYPTRFGLVDETIRH